MSKSVLDRMTLDPEIGALLRKARVTVPDSRDHLVKLALDGKDRFEVGYDVPGRGWVAEATVVRCRNGVCVNYVDPYMRRRDPDCMVIADAGPTDKERFDARYGQPFDDLRSRTLSWLADYHDLLVMPFTAGRAGIEYPALLVGPANSGFFAAGLADLQGFIPSEQVPQGFAPRALILLAPPFRHTFFKGRQMVVHNRAAGRHEMFSYNLYPGPSAKKGVYGILLAIGEDEGWTTLHCSAVKVVTPYEHEFTIMHEGASGGGKSEMIQELHREQDGSICLAENTVSGERISITLSDACELHPVTDDMALTHPRLQNGHSKLIAADAEEGWFLRVDHIGSYGVMPFLEKLMIHPAEPLVFLNLDGQPGATCLPWDHIMDAPGKPCPNPRVIMPRRLVPRVIDAPVEIDVRSFGVRTPPTTRERPNYGIIGLFHVLPPALAWLWRLVAPRGHANPSVVGGGGLESEGVGSYWPFATGRRVAQANLLLDQIVATPETRFKLIPNQYVGAYRVGFMPEWIAREYLSRRGSVRFKPEQLLAARCPLLGWVPATLKIDGHAIPRGLLQVDEQPEVGSEAYDRGAAIITEFFKQEIRRFLEPDLSPLGRRIIDICLSDGTASDYRDAVSR